MPSHPIPNVNGIGSAAAALTRKTEIAVILDRSGSMEAIATDAIGGFNAFVASQQSLPPPSPRSQNLATKAVAGDARRRRPESEATRREATRFTLVLFDDRYEVPIKSAPIDQVPPLTRQTFAPRGSTALLDAIGRTLKKMTESFAARSPARRPDTIIVAILTDGEENASRLFSHAHIADLIAEKRAQGWEFIFLAANQDAIASAARLSIPSVDAESFATTPSGTQAAFGRLNDRVREKRGR